MVRILTPILCLAAVSLARGQALPIQQDGQVYYVSPDNRSILRVEAASETQAVSLCSEETPCLYDDLQDKADLVPTKLWTTTGITYSFGPTTDDIEGNSEGSLAAQAFGLWSNVAKVRPVEVADGGNDSLVGQMRQLWAVGAHGDDMPFDGPGGVLAHCFPPPADPASPTPLAGDCHYDDAEAWDSPLLPGSGLDLVTVMAHNIGHGLGLGHSSDPNALMFNAFTGRRAYLSFDDISKIVALYGTRTEDVIFQLEVTRRPLAGTGSFRLRENSVRLDFHQKGSPGDAFKTRMFPSATANTEPDGTSDVDGVLSNPSLGTQFDGFIFQQGDLYRGHITMDAQRRDIDVVKLTLNITDNSLTRAVRLQASMNGRVIGSLFVQPGDSERVVFFVLTPPFVNPTGGNLREGENPYNRATQ
jgi:Matrixin